ncbi:MAG TPA: hypothetical protein PLO61_07835 [Fimbriimonadaceae bacterium]|nr:hypothetical protein [Fimbriimonadaceae bacterium]HRJ32628.1 hypothetical protein [Fimbriimonadaceae bacterium]
MKITLCRFCDTYLQTSDNKNCMIGLFDSIGSQSFPFKQDTFHLCFEMEFEVQEANKEVELVVRMTSESSKELFAVNAKFTVPDVQRHSRSRIFQNFKVQNLEFTEPGVHKVEFQINGKLVHEELIFVAKFD